MKSVSSIENLIACLMTHQHHLKKAINSPEKFINTFQTLTIKEKKDFIVFINTYSTRLEITSSFMIKKRWEDMQNGLEFIIHLFRENELKKIWEIFISTEHLDESIPENPLTDTLLFLRYLKKECQLDIVRKELLDYQLTKLQVMLELDHDGFLKIFINKSPFEDDDQIILNPTIKYKNFTNKISVIVQYLNKHKSMPPNLTEYQSSESLIIYANYSKNIATSIALKPYLKDLLSTLSKGKGIVDTYKSLSATYNLDEKAFKSNLKSLNDINLIRCKNSIDY